VFVSIVCRLWGGWGGLGHVRKHATGSCWDFRRFHSSRDSLLQQSSTSVVNITLHLRQPQSLLRHPVQSTLHQIKHGNSHLDEGTRIMTCTTQGSATMHATWTVAAAPSRQDLHPRVSALLLHASRENCFSIWGGGGWVGGHGHFDQHQHSSLSRYRLTATRSRH